MAFGIVLLTGIALLYWLLVKGYLWKIIIGVCGAFGLHLLLLHFFPDSRSICIVLDRGGITWAAVISVGVLLLAMMHTKAE